MDLEALTLRYFLKIFSLIFIILLCYLTLITIFFKINKIDKTIYIEKGENIKFINNKISSDKNYLDRKIYLIILKLINQFNNIHYGEFLIKKNSNFFDFVKVITSPSNIKHEIRLINGWYKYQLKDYLSNFLNKKFDFILENVISDTYFINKSNSINELTYLMLSEKNKIFSNNKNSLLLKEYSYKEIMIIASLVEKEALDENDKYNVSSVIINRLNRKMRLQIDATVIYSITEGKYKLERELTYDDLKIKHPFNTYKINALPPDLISTVSKKTIEIVLENYKTNYLYYFYNKIENKHIYSINFKNHKLKLNEYRKRKK